MKSFANGNGQGVAGECASGQASAATPLITTGKPPHEHHWWYLVNGGG